MKAIAALTILLALVCAALANTSCIHQLGAFQRIADAPTAVTEASCTHAGGRLYVFMGSLAFNTTTGLLPASNASYALNLDDGAWVRLADAPFAGTHAATAHNATHVFLAGGFEGAAPGTAVANVSAYSIAADAWAPLPSLPRPSAAGALVHVAGELFYFGGLRDADTPDDAAWVLNLTAPAAQWTPLAAHLPEPRAHAAALLLDRLPPVVLIPGGVVGNASVPRDLASAIAFDPASLQFSAAAALPSNRSHYGADVANASGCCPARALLFGGRDTSVPRVLDTVIEYAPDENVWLTIGNLPHQWFTPCGAYHVNASGAFLFVAVGGLDFFLPTNETVVAPVAPICNPATTPVITPGPTASLPVTAPPLPTPGPTSAASGTGTTGTSGTGTSTGTSGTGTGTGTSGTGTSGTGTGTTTGVTTAPNGTTIAPNGTTIAPNSTTIAPNGTTIAPNGTTIAPNGTTIAPNGTTIAPNGTTIAPNGTTHAANTTAPVTTGTTAPPTTGTTAPPPTTGTTAPPTPSPTTGTTAPPTTGTTAPPSPATTAPAPAPPTTKPAAK